MSIKHERMSLYIALVKKGWSRFLLEILHQRNLCCKNNQEIGPFSILPLETHYSPIKSGIQSPDTSITRLTSCILTVQRISIWFPVFAFVW